MSAIDPTLASEAMRWVAADPDPATRDEVADLIDAAEAGDAEAAAELADRFAAALDFGTAGLRGALGGGPNRMNLAVVTRAAAGIVTWLQEHGGPGAAERGVVVGRDARHGSEAFAERSAAIFAAAGIKAHVLPRPLPTPLVPFAIGHLGAAAGVMVTASHNPPQDNGYKVYDASGRQIVAPDDARIAQAMAAVARPCDVPYARPEDPDIMRLDGAVVEAYLDAAVARCVVPGARSVRVAYTPLHGVGADALAAAFDRAGFPSPAMVASQRAPDPAFPTVRFPNPEEPGALDAALALGTEVDAQVVLANDPDADRLGMAVPDGAAPAGWRTLRGDEIGPILVHHLLRHGAVASGGVFATTIVSSSLLEKVAAAAGVPYVETLTGFKWIGRAAGAGQHLAFGYEEALGFCVGGPVRDKDGISAALVAAEAVAALAAEGRTVLDVLDELHLAHGVHHTGQHAIRVAGTGGLERIAAAMAALRAAPPASVAGSEVREVVDFLHPGGLGGLPPADVVVLRFDGARLVVRPSGTEPKLKQYVEVVVPVPGPEALAAARAKAARRAGELVAGLGTAIDRAGEIAP